ncbi:MAG: dockerin type I domain-containing protein [Pseudomonadota bacterium]
MFLKSFRVASASLLLITALSVDAVGTEDSNNCRGTTSDFCERSGSCSIQGSDWYQYVTIDKSDIFDTQGWPGLCDMVHVSLVQGDCSPPSAQVDVTAYLSTSTFADIPGISGILVCNAEIVADGDLAPWDALDGEINGADVLIAIQLVLGQRMAGSLQYTHGDMNQDEVIDLADLLLIQQALLQ